MDEQLIRECILIFDKYDSALRAVLEMARILQMAAGEISEERQQELAMKELMAKDLVLEAQTSENTLRQKYNIRTQGDTQTNVQ